MRVLVTYASRYGATREIAERIGAVLSRQGIKVSTSAVTDVEYPQAYDALVIGSASYFFHWMSSAQAFVRRNRIALAQRPVWLFSSGPLGSSKTDSKGKDLCEVCEPREIEEFRKSIRPRAHRVFFGAFAPQKPDLLHRLLRILPAAKMHAIFPEGDFRSWEEIDLWASNIARELQRTPRILYDTPTLTP
jgi:menaquinone-dependent protoporphyrinogen oxidase